MVKKIKDVNSNDFDLEILPVKKDRFGINTRRPTHPLLPKIHEGANVLMVSSIKSGKTNTLVNLFLNPNFFKDAHDSVYIFSTTLHQDQTGRKLIEEFPATSYDSFDEGKLQRILDYQQQADDDEREAIALVFDDLPHNLKRNSLFFTIASKQRHYGANVFYSVQNFKMVPPVVRNNATNLILGTLNSSQLDQIAAEYGDGLGGEDNFKKYHRLTVPERFNFMYVKLDEFPNQIYKAFTDKLLYQDDM